MQNVSLEQQLILVDIADRMLDYVSLQPDIDETKVKAATIAAQRVDIERLIGKEHVQSCFDPQTELDEQLIVLITPPLCYFTYSRMLKLFPGTFTESGYVVEGAASSIGTSKSAANEAASTAEVFMEDVFDFLELNYPNDEEVKPENKTPNIRVFGGKEFRASN